MSDRRRIEVRVVPGARRSHVVETDSGTLKVRVAAPAVDGKANRELLRILAAHLGVRARELTIVSGEHHRTKIVEVRDP